MRPATTSGSAYVVVGTGPWIFGKKVMLPAGVISRVDEERREGVRQPHERADQELAGVRPRQLTSDASYRTQLGAYYGHGGAGWQDW